jgi:hypothetical protein
MLPLHAAARPQRPDLPERHETQTVTTRLSGTLVDPRGSPLARAVVVSSAGGQAISGADGSFRLSVMLAPSASSLRVTAASGSGQDALLASAEVVTPAAGGTLEIGTLHASLTSGCQPAWLPTFGGQPGTNGDVWALAVFDDGSGPALYVGGQFTGAGGVPANDVARWNGSSWSALGSGIVDGMVFALAVFDDGSGPALYVGGNFSSAGGVSAPGAVKWDGANWSALGTGIPSGLVQALAVYDDGSGPALYASGSFASAGGVPAANIARWKGSSWSTLGSGLTGYQASGYALAVFDDGGGSALYAGGQFTDAGGVPAMGLAKWDGTSWSALGSGVNGSVYSLAVFDEGQGPSLFAGGGFSNAGGVPVNSIARWDGSSWSALGSGLSGGVYALAVADDGSGPALFAGGWLEAAGGAAHDVARWNGSTWSALGSGIAGGQPATVRALAGFDVGSGPALYAGGGFTSAGGLPANNLASWRASSWSLLGDGLNDSANALTVFDDGAGPALYAGGRFKTAGGVETKGIGRWDGSSWSALGSGVIGSVWALAVYDDGSGPALYVGGDFSTAGGVVAHNIAKWNGSVWSALGSGTSGWVECLAVHDEGQGPALYAGGIVTGAGGVPVFGVARWNGAQWSAMGSGVGMNSNVMALCVFDDGGGPFLYAAGAFTTADGQPANHIAKWKGSTWQALGEGLTGGFLQWVSALSVHDDGGGSALYAGGLFTIAGHQSAIDIAKWDGTDWSAVGLGMNGPVGSLASFDDGSGSALYAGGGFTAAGGLAVGNIARWDGAHWSPLGAGMDGDVGCLAPFDGGGGAALYAGGTFTSALDSGDSFLAEWGNPAGCGAPGSVVCEPGVGGVSACPCGNPPAGSGLGCDNSSHTGGAQLAATGIARIAYDSVVFTTSGERPSATSIVLQGDALNAGGATFGQGVRCIAGSVKRLYVKTASGGSIRAPSPSDPRVHARSAALGDPIAPGTHRFYGVYYRDPQVLGGCAPASTFNFTQQLDLLWSP